MKTITKIICLAALLLAVTIAPLPAQTAQSENTTDTNANSLAPQALPKPQMPPMQQRHEYVDHQTFPPDLLHSVVPIVAIVTPFGCIVAVAGLIFKARRRRIELLHETLRAMIEKGVPIPPELIAPPKAQLAPGQSPFDVFPSRKKSDFRSGLMMLAFGFGLLIFFVSIDMKIWPVGFIFMLLGGALLLVHKLENKNDTKTELAPK